MCVFPFVSSEQWLECTQLEYNEWVAWCMGFRMVVHGSGEGISMKVATGVIAKGKHPTIHYLILIQGWTLTIHYLIVIQWWTPYYPLPRLIVIFCYLADLAIQRYHLWKTAWTMILHTEIPSTFSMTRVLFWWHQNSLKLFMVWALYGLLFVDPYIHTCINALRHWIMGEVHTGSGRLARSVKARIFTRELQSFELGLLNQVIKPGNCAVWSVYFAIRFNTIDIARRMRQLKQYAPMVLRCTGLCVIDKLIS